MNQIEVTRQLLTDMIDPWSHIWTFLYSASEHQIIEKNGRSCSWSRYPQAYSRYTWSNYQCTSVNREASQSASGPIPSRYRQSGTLSTSCPMFVPVTHSFRLWKKPTFFKACTQMKSSRRAIWKRAAIIKRCLWKSWSQLFVSATRLDDERKPMTISN